MVKVSCLLSTYTNTPHCVLDCVLQTSSTYLIYFIYLIYLINVNNQRQLRHGNFPNQQCR